MKQLPKLPTPGNFTLDEDDSPNLASYLTEEPDVTEGPQVTVALPAAPAKQEKVQLDKLELPNGYRIEPEEWGIDLGYEPQAEASKFETDLPDDEPAHVVEVPAELREFMNSEEAKNLTPDQLKEVVGSALQDEALKMWKAAKAKAGVRDRHTAIVRGSILAGVVLFLLLFSVKTAVVIALLGFLTVAGIYFWNRADSTQEGVNGSIGRFKEQLAVYRSKAAKHLEEARERMAAQRAAQAEAARLAALHGPTAPPPTELPKVGDK